MFTGQRTDATDETIYDGDIVIFDGLRWRSRAVAAGERVVEAVFGYSTNVVPSGHGSVGYGGGRSGRPAPLAGDRPDPEVQVGSWIADVTYEPSTSATTPARPSGRRRRFIPVSQHGVTIPVAKKSPPDACGGFTSDNAGPIGR